MALGPQRFRMIGETPYAHEREGLELVREALPDTDPYQAWALVELLDTSRGALYELDVVVLGYSALYLVELKAHSGRIESNGVDWQWTPQDGPARYMRPPYATANHKAKVLKGRLEAKMQHRRTAPRVEALVFLSAADLDLRLRPEGEQNVVTRKNLRDALVHHQFPGSAMGWQGQRIPRPVMLDVCQALDKIGFRARKGKQHVGSYELGQVLAEGAGYQDRETTHRENPHIHGRARTYLVPDQTTVERRQQLLRAAKRESQLLYDVREHPNVLQFNDYVSDAALGPTVLFDPFEGAVSLDTFLRQEPDLDMDDRFAIVEQVGHALAFCHRKSVVHGAICPDSILVRRHPDTGAIDTRLYNFQLGSSLRVESTSHLSAFTADPWIVYQAPEVRENPANRSPQGDLFSLGAVAYRVFTGQAPGADLRDVHLRLVRDGHLDPAQVMEGEISEALSGAIIDATKLSRAQRVDDVDFWIELLKDSLTAPPEVTTTSTATEEDPLEARKDTVLRDLRVIRVLGHGATSRVLYVTRQTDNRDFALKVSLNDQQDERFAGEAKVLRDLHHQRIVQLVEELTLAGRACLLLSLAGARTLQQELHTEGTISLDYAARYGEDLLSALEHLEERGVIHRDIKPANLGVGSAGKSKNHLQLFDFSLVDAPLRELGVGTSAYRDPFLPERGSWDPAADRWSAAVTLHEMLTGVRPSFGGGAAIAPDAKLELAAERFDPAARESLVRFFERALHRDVERRFESAERMRREWALCFDPPHASLGHLAPIAPAAATPRPASERPPQPTAASNQAAPAPTGEPPSAPDDNNSAPDDTTTHADPTDTPTWSLEQLAAILPSTPVEALPLSVRARNALDRAGVTQAHDLLSLADNRLSAIRGVGRKVAREVLALRDQWRSSPVSGPLGELHEEPFFRTYQGEPRPVRDTALPAAVKDALDDAGLPTLDAVATSPKAQVEAITKRAGFRSADLHKLLVAEQRAAMDSDRPSTLPAWLALLFAKKRKPSAHLMALFGIAPPFEGRLDVQVRDVAAHFACTRENIYNSLRHAREAWEEQDAVADLCNLVDQMVSAADGALPLPHAVELLLERLPHDASTPQALLAAQAAALFRVAAEVAKETVDGVRHVRMGEGSSWMVASQEHGEAIRRLGDAAQLLAEREVLASPAEAQREFEEATRGTPLEGVSPARLADFAAAASAGAARSSRLEIYPTAMPPERTLELIASAGVLKSGVTRDVLVKRVAARFPSAASLPERPELDALLANFKLVWDAATSVYVRSGEAQVTVLSTAHQGPTAHTSNVNAARARVRATEDQVSAREFDDKLRVALDKRLFRVVGVRVNQAAQATQALSARLGIAPTSLDSLFLAAIRHNMAQKKVREDVIHAADREGPEGKGWSNLRTLVRGAASSVASGLLPAKAPLLLTHPGMIDRYELSDFLATLVKSGQEHDDAPCFLLVPSYDDGRVPRINGAMPIPGVLDADALWVPSAWLRAQQALTQQASA